MELPSINNTVSATRLPHFSLSCLLSILIVPKMPNAVRQRKHFSDEVTPSLCGVFKATKWAVEVGNSGRSALGLRSTRTASTGPLQPATPSSAGRIAASPASILRSRENQRVHPAKTMPGIHTDFLFTRLRSLHSAQAHSRLRGRHVTEQKTPQRPGDIVLKYSR
jgi:hypothetical protein